MTQLTPAQRQTLDAQRELERYQPIYPEALFELLSRELRLPERPRVVDVGAGSGRASLPMARRGWEVIAVEPDGHILEVLRYGAIADGLKVTAVQATAEATTLEPASADLVAASHSFHWFDAPRALAEMTRITRPGGAVALFWTVRDCARSPFVADYVEMFGRYGMPKRLYREAERVSGRPARKALAGAEGFGPPRLHQISHEMPMRPAEVMEMAFRPAYVRGLTEDRQSAFRDELGDLLTTHGLTGDEPFPWPYLVNCWIVQRTTTEQTS